MGFGKLLGIAAICAGVYFAGDFTLKKTDNFMRTHKSYSRVEPSYGYLASRCGHEKDIKEYEASLERIPDQIQDIVNDYHGRVYFYELGDKLVDSETSTDTLKRIGFYSFFDPVRGMEKGMFVSCINEDKTKRNTALHEYGHAIDDFVGNEFFGKLISETEPVKKMFKNYEQQFFCDSGLPLCDLYSQRYYSRINPGEFVAETVLHYYMSKESRKQLKKKYPEIFEFYRHIEKKAIRERGITSKHNLASEALFDLFMVKTGIAPKIMKLLN